MTSRVFPETRYPCKPLSIESEAILSMEDIHGALTGIGMESNKGRGSLTSRYLAALLAPVVIAGVMQVTWPFFQPTPFLPTLLAVIFCAWYGGLGPGLLSVVISFLLIDFFFIEPYSFFWFPKQLDLTRVLAFAVAGPFISVMSELLHRERRRAGINLEAAKRAEEALREKERFVNQIAELSPVVINVFDLATRRNVYISPDVVNLLGYTPKEIAEMEDPFSVLWHPEDIPRASENLARLKHARDGEIAEFEYRIRRRDGEWRWVASRIMPFERDEHGVVQQIITASIDITERKQTEAALRESTRKLNATIDNLSGFVYRCANHPNWPVEYMSQGIFDLLGYQPEEFVSGKHMFGSFIAPADRDRVWAEVQAGVEARRPYVLEYRVHTTSGEERWVWEKGAGVFDDEKLLALEGFITDITARKRAEEALRESEERYRELFENAKDAIYVQDLAGVYTSVNRAAEKLSGYDRNEIRGKHFDQFVAPEYLPLVCTKFSKKLADKWQTAYEVEVIARDGRRVPVELSSALILKHGVPIGIQGIARDITERKRAEETLRESEKHFRYLIENMLDGFAYCRMLFDDNGSPVDFIYLDVSDVFYKLSGLENVIQRRITEIFPNINELHPEMLEIYGRVALTGKPERFELYFKPLDRWLDISVYSSERGYFVAVFDNITERKRAEEAMSDLRRELELTMNSMEEGVHRVNLQGDIVFENPAAARMLGWEVAELLGKPAHLTMHHTRQDGTPYPREECPIYVTLSDGVTRQVADEVFWRRDGTSFPVEYTTAPMRNDRNEIVAAVVTFRDITERKRAEETLRSYSRQLIDAQETERQHIARELHDQIGQMLTAIRINLQTIENSGETAESRPLIDQGVALIDAALEQVRDLSFELRPSLLDNLGLVAALRWYSDQYTRRTGIRTRSVTNLPGGQTRLTQELETACFRIVQEALTNVVRHANAKNVSIDLRKLDHKIVLSIKDDGIGFDESSPNGDASATRLGLRGMKERALALGGTLEIESAPARGTEIRACFPTESKGD